MGIFKEVTKDALKNAFGIGKSKKGRICIFCKSIHEEDNDFWWPIEAEDICLSCFRAGVIWACHEAHKEK